MCLNLLLCTLENNLAGIQIGRRRMKTTVVASADYVTMFAKSPTDIPTTQQALYCFEVASGAKLNTGKSRVLAIGPWDTSVRIMDFPYHTEAKFLGFHITSNVQDSTHKSWTINTARIHVQSQDAYYRMIHTDRTAKSCALFLYRLRQEGLRSGTLSAE